MQETRRTTEPADTQRQEMLRFLEIDQGTSACLEKFLPILEKHVDELLDAFYDHVTAWPHLAALVGDAGNIPRLKEAQLKHWRLLFGGRFDGDYEAQVRRVGLAHQRIGLEPSWYFGAYSFVLTRLSKTLAIHFKRKPDQLSAMLAAVTKAVFLDMDLVMAVYAEELRADHKNQLESLAGDLEADVKAVADSVSSAAAEMQDSARSLAATSEETSSQSEAVAGAAVQASANVQAVASAAEEMSGSIQEFGRQVASSLEVARRAVEEVGQTNDSIQGLAASGEKIGDVVSLISDIAGQTNLLALNATIEAARAGEAGKGFAVVASEVKALANQTAQATEDIAAQIAAMKSEMDSSVAAIGRIGTTISDISEVATSIASAVEEQSAATGEIARNVEEAAVGTRQTSESIEGVSEAATRTGRAASQVLTAAGAVSQQGDALRQKVNAFVTALRAS